MQDNYFDLCKNAMQTCIHIPIMGAWSLSIGFSPNINNWISFDENSVPKYCNALVEIELFNYGTTISDPKLEYYNGVRIFPFNKEAPNYIIDEIARLKSVIRQHNLDAQTLE